MLYIFFFKQKTAYEMRISDWSSDVCSSDLVDGSPTPRMNDIEAAKRQLLPHLPDRIFGNVEGGHHPCRLANQNAQEIAEPIPAWSRDYDGAARLQNA